MSYDQISQLLDALIKLLVIILPVMLTQVARANVQVRTRLNISAEQEATALRFVKAAAQTMSDKAAMKSWVVGMIESAFPHLAPSEVDALIEAAVNDYKRDTPLFGSVEMLHPLDYQPGLSLAPEPPPPVAQKADVIKPSAESTAAPLAPKVSPSQPTPESASL